MLSSRGPLLARQISCLQFHSVIYAKQVLIMMNMSSQLYVVLISIEFPLHTFYIYMISLVSEFWYQQISQVEEGCEFSYIKPKLQATYLLTYCDCRAYKIGLFPFERKPESSSISCVPSTRNPSSLIFVLAHKIDPSFKSLLFQIFFQGLCYIQFTSLDLEKSFMLCM